MAVLSFATLIPLPGCAERYEAPVTEGRDLRLTILHTTDIHSRLLPYDMTVLAGDRALGLQQEHAPFGGIARVAHVIQRERARAARSIYVDSGDCFQGAPIFNAFRGEAEQRALSLMRPDAVVIGNHEFDEGLKNYVAQLKKWATYPVVAANYLFEPGQPLGEIAQPVEVINADGLAIGIIGVANFSSISSITEVGNSLHLTPLEIHAVVQEWIDILEPHVDLIVAVSHGGLGEDEEMIKATTGLDLVMGGHLHIVLMPPKVIQDKSGRDVVLAHSGAFAKFVGKLDVVVRDGDVIAHDYEVFPIDSRVPEDAQMAELIEPYRFQLHQMIDLESVYGFATRLIRRFGFDGGDSPLGNLVAEAIRQYARSDFGMTNSLGIRTDVNPGPITLDQLYNVFPFNNYVTTMYLSGTDVQSLLDFATRRAAGRGCATQIQVSGIEFVMDCRFDVTDCGDECPPRATDIFLTDCGDPTLTDKTGCQRVPLDPNAVYEMATNDYIARGGSGFTVLKVNNTQVVSDVALRDAMLETVIRSPLCVEECRNEATSDLELDGCIGYEICVEDLTSFYTRHCTRVAETSVGETTLPERCAVDLGGICESAQECWSLGACTEETCKACESVADCDVDGDIEAVETCLDGFCRPTNTLCLEDKCERVCIDDEDCPGSHLLSGNGQRICVEGKCLPREGAACAQDLDCVDVDAVCDLDDDGVGSLCAECSVDDDCATGQSCVATGHPDHPGRCVTPIATCADRRCRLNCEGNADCLSGETCNEVGYCIPTECDVETDLQTACEMSAQWRAMERCLTVPCPQAETDGRIGRILPANLDNLPFQDDIDDDQ